MPVVNRNVLLFITAILIYTFYYARSYGPSAQRRKDDYHRPETWHESAPEGFDTADQPTSLFPHDIDPMQDLSTLSAQTGSPKEGFKEGVEEPKWYFQDDLPFPNPAFDIRKLKRYAPHNYRGPGGDTFATYLATRNSTLQDPYFQAAQQLAYRILWDPKSKSNQHPFTVFVAPFIPIEQRDLLLAAGAVVKELELIEGHTPMPGFGRWRDLFSKLNLWNQTEFNRISFLDVDAFPTQNLDGIFDAATAQRCRPDLLPAEDSQFVSDICDYHFSGVSVGTSDQINVGVVVLSPNAAMHRRLMRESLLTENFDNTLAEQAFLNYAFRPDGPFPMELIDRQWNGFFPKVDEMGWLKVVHEKLWSIDRTGEEGLQWMKNYFGDKWTEMLTLYHSRRFENMRSAGGPVA